MKVITDKRHRIYFSDREVRKIRSLARDEKITMNKLSQELGLTTMSLWRKFARKNPFLWLEVAKLEHLGILWVENHEQLIRLKDKV